MKQDNKKQGAIFAAVGMFPVVWLALLVAPTVHGGLPLIVKNFSQAIAAPFSLSWHEDSLKTVLLFLCAYGLGIGIYFATRRNYRSGSGKTLKSIQITLAARLEKFNLPSLATLTERDELEIEKMGEEKTVLYMIIPDNDDSFNFLVSILYLQLFQVLFAIADQEHKGGLPVPVHFLMDEFANIPVANDFPKILSVMRSRNVFVSIILQNIAQLKALFEKQWESILGNCDQLLYLGGNESSTHKLISESYLGKETIDTNSYGKTSGLHGSYSTNYQQAGRELLTPDEVRMLDNQYALLFIRGERPVKDLKYDLMKHPNIQYTPDGDGQPYVHQKARRINLDTDFDLEFLTEEEFMKESR